MKTAIAIRHVSFEDLGSLAPVLERRGYALRYLEAGTERLDASELRAADLVIILGGPIAAYQAADYPWLAAEIEIARLRIAEERALLGICLGSQIMAKAAGARVQAMGKMEFGWAPVSLTPEGEASPLRELAATAVLHWHGDTFELPAGAQGLAYSSECANQAFRLGPAALGLQFHPEIDWPGFERWLIGGVSTLGRRGISIPAFRAESQRCARLLAPAAARMLERWLDGIPARDDAAS